MHSFYLFGSRVATHVLFWLIYYLAFGYIWANHGNYRDSYFLEFVLLPVRMLAVYLTIYWLIPNWLKPDSLLKLSFYYLLLILGCAVLQRGFTFFFYEGMTMSGGNLLSLSGVFRNIILINSTVLFVSSLKIIQLWWQEKSKVNKLEHLLGASANPSEFIEIKSEKRMHRIHRDQLLYVEGLGNYVIFHTADKHHISYTSLKDTLDKLPDYFKRIHKSYVVNTHKVNSYDQENVDINGKLLPVGKSFREQLIGKN
jgi:hypothetical protein